MTGITPVPSINGKLYEQGYIPVAAVPESQVLSWHIFKEIIGLVDNKYTQLTVIDAQTALAGTKGILLTPTNSILKESAHIIYAKTNPVYIVNTPDVKCGELLNEKSHHIKTLSEFKTITNSTSSLNQNILHNLLIEDHLYLSDIIYNKKDFAESLIFSQLKFRREKASRVKLLPGDIATQNSVVEHPELQNMLFVYTNLDKYTGKSYSIGDFSLESFEKIGAATVAVFGEPQTIFSNKKLDPKVNKK
jgi:hypothetical protein